MNTLNHDAIIDRVAREMTEGEPSARFRARVLQRLPPARRTPWIRIAIPAGAMAMGLLWVLAGFPKSTRPSTSLDGSAVSNTPARSSGATTPQTIANASPAPVSLAEAGPAAPVGGAPSTATAPPAAPAAVDPDEPAGPGLLEPLSVPAPIVIEPIQPIATSIAPITVDPIVLKSTTPPAPIDPRAGGSQGAPTAPTR